MHLYKTEKVYLLSKLLKQYSILTRLVSVQWLKI